MGVHFKENEEKITLGMIITGIVIIAVLLTSIIIYLLNIKANNSGNIATEEYISSKQEQLDDDDDDDDEYETVSIEIGKTVEEASDELNKALNEANKQTEQNSTENTSINNSLNTNSVNTSNSQNTPINTKKEESGIKEEKVKEELKKQIKFTSPVKGEIIREFAPDSLVFSETLQEWITHNGVDIKADKTSVVTAACDGTVSAIKNDPRYGLTVIIEHEDGYQTIYANLLTAEFVVQGEKVQAGQTIGTIGNTANFEIADDYHLHFEIKKDGDYLNPVSYIEI